MTASVVCLWNHGTDLRVQKIGTAKDQVLELRKAVWMYYRDTGTFPPAESGLAALVTNPGSEAWRGPYLEADAIPRDPWGGRYECQGPEPGTGRYRILSAGPDGRFGSEDDIRISLGEPGWPAGQEDPVLVDAAAGRAGNA
jgi:type II secretion system protein G